MADKPEPQTFSLAVGQAKTLVFAMDTPPAGGVGSWGVRFRMRDRDGGSVLVEKATGDGVTLADADAGVWEVEVGTADTGTLKPGVRPWAFWRVNDEDAPIALGTCEVYRTAETG